MVPVPIMETATAIGGRINARIVSDSAETDIVLAILLLMTTVPAERADTRTTRASEAAIDTAPDAVTETCFAISFTEETAADEVAEICFDIPFTEETAPVLIKEMFFATALAIVTVPVAATFTRTRIDFI